MDSSEPRDRRAWGAVTATFTGTFDFSGRSDRYVFWWGTLGVLIAQVLVVTALTAVFYLVALTWPTASPMLLAGLWMSACLVLTTLLQVPLLALSVRRLRDASLSPWWALAWLNMLTALALLCFLGFSPSKSEN